MMDKKQSTRSLLCGLLFVFIFIHLRFYRFPFCHYLENASTVSTDPV